MPGIGSVQVFGAGQYAMRLWVKPDQLAKLADHRTGNRQRHSGPEHRESGRTGRRRTGAERPGIHLFGARPGPPDFTGREFGEHRGPRQPDGAIVRVKDVARVELGAQDYNLTGRLERQAGRDHRRVSVARFQRR